MSLRINSNNIYCISPYTKYNNDNINDFMKNDFTISVRVKIYKENMKLMEDNYIFSRNGMHCGILVNLNSDNGIDIKFAYWFIDKNGNSVFKNIYYSMPLSYENEFNNYAVTCNDSNKLITFYFNDVKIGDINYLELIKYDYTNSFIWLGCGDMSANDVNYRFAGDFEYEYVYALDKELNINEILDINYNYKSKLNYDSEYYLPILNTDIDNFTNFKIFTDFDYKCKYKLWNMADNHNFFQLYIENNIMF